MKSKTFTFIRKVVLASCIACSPAVLSAQAISEGFDDVTTLPGSGWSLQNLSSPIGTTNWLQGNTGQFGSQNGANNSYIAANSNNGAGTATLSNWLITPNRTFRNGDVVTFYTRTVLLSLSPDRLQVRMSTNGASTNVGATATSVGDFVTLLTEVNPNQVALVYPASWTQISLTIGGLAAPTSGRLALRYFVTNGGPSGGNSNYIGIDNFVYTPYVCPTVTVNPATLPTPVLGTAYNQSLSQTGSNGTPVFSSTGGLPPGLTLSPAGVLSGTPATAGTYSFSAVSTDASGCTGSRSYTFTITCPTITINPASLPNGTAGAVYNQTLTQSGGIGTTTYTVSAGTLPAGLSLSTAGAITGTPTAGGSSTFTILATTTSNCSASRIYTITIGCPTSTASLSPFSAACSNAPSITLTGGSPSGGTYSGTGVSNGMFNPATGTQVINYTVASTYSGCPNTATQTFFVNQAPVVAFASMPAMCSNALPFTLGNATPMGGTYSGTGVNDNTFSPSAGTQMVKYVVTNAAGCKDSATQVVTVNTTPLVSIDSLPASLCADSSMITLVGSPTGGTFSGSTVSGNTFTAAFPGSFVVGYSYTAANGCAASATRTVVVLDCDSTVPVKVGNAITESALLSCFPNPTTGSLQVAFSSKKNSEGYLRIMSATGQVMLSNKIASTKSYSTSLDLSGLPKGYYMVSVTMGDSHTIRKILLK